MNQDFLLIVKRPVIGTIIKIYPHRVNLVKRVNMVNIIAAIFQFHDHVNKRKISYYEFVAVGEVRG